MKTNKVIGIPGYKYKDDHFGVGINHIEFVNQFGNPRIIMPWEPFVQVDMLYLPGGLDVNPAHSGSVPSFATSNQDVFKEWFYTQRLKAYIDANIPIFGVCLGMQMLATYFGGVITQNLLFHKTSTDRWTTAHNVYPAKFENLPFNVNAYKRFAVNSHHHQALTVSGLIKDGVSNPDILPLFYTRNADDYFTNEGYIIEAIAIKDKPIVGVQWHPEENFDNFSIETINTLLTQ